MKNSSRRPVRSPVGNKTKRGAELEGTPKTPRSFDVSPCKSTSCVEGFSQQLEDRRLQSRSRRPLQWNKQGVNDLMAAEGMTKDLQLETTLSAFLHWDLKSTGESLAVSALSPICVNAIQGNADPQGRWKAAMKKPSEMPPSLASQKKVKDCDAALKRKGHGGVLEDAHWNSSEDNSEAGPGSCPSSPQNQISEERIFFWSNAAFNHGLAHEETICISKGTGSSSGCSSSSSCSRHKAAIIERADCEAESKTKGQDPLPGIDGARSCNARKSPTVDVTAKTKNGMGSSKSYGPEDQEIRGDCTSESTCALSSELTESDAFPYLLQQRSEPKEHTDIQKSVLQASQASKDEEERFEIGLDEIDQEIQRLTERLTELQLQKREWEKEMSRHGEEKKKKVESASYVGRKGLADRERSVVAMLQQGQCKRAAAVSGAKRGKGPVISISSNSASPRAQSLRPTFHENVVKVESPLPLISRRVQCSSSVGKLSELRRSVSAASPPPRKESGEADRRSKVLRRRLSMSMSGAIRSSPSSKGNCTPSRVVSSRYGRDACRLSCKKQDRLASSPSRPLPAQPSTSVVASSPLKKIATLRRGYPSRSGFATPTKERHQLSSIRAGAGAGVESTSALHKCLESLLQDSKHFSLP